jgi:hypothetical protein
MRRVSPALIPLLLAGCPGKDPECVIILKSVYPESGSTNGYYRAAIDFELSNPDPAAVITTDIPGAQSTSSDGKHILWTPSEPLDPNTAYSACLSWCGGDTCTDFTTSSAGLPLDDRDALVGNSYIFDLHSGRVPIPAGLGDVLIDNLEAVILLGVTSVGTSSVDLIGAVSDLDLAPDVVQDYCAPTIGFAGADFSDEPYVSFGNPAFTLTAAGETIDVFDAELTGTFAPDGSAIEGMTFHGTIDTRPLAPLVDDGDGSEGAICDLAENFNTSCVTCPSDGQNFCLEIEADHITAALADLNVVPICEANAPACDPGPPEDTCD